MERQRTIILYVFSAAALFLLFPFSLASKTKGHGELFMTADVSEVIGKSYDYIIVGGGTSGCSLAATLSKRYLVLIVERGGSPFGNNLIEEESSLGFFNVQPEDLTSVFERFVSEEGVANVRGRVLGGTTAINGGFYSRASEDFINRAGWDGELVKDAYQWVESKVVFRPQMLNPWQSVFKEGLVETGVVPFNGFTLEHLEGTKIGGRTFDKYGKRHTAAELLMAGDQKKIIVLLNTTVQNVIFQHTGNGKNPRAYGVRFLNSLNANHDVHEVYLNQNKRSRFWGDVILSAGALGSPQILMLSGIGPKEYLKQLNISPLIHSNEVGKGMRDPPSVAFVLNISQALQEQPPSGTQVAGVVDEFKIIIESGILPQSSNTVAIVIASKVARPSSRGELRLNSTDPKQKPLVKFNYLQEENDLDECAKMARLIEEVARTKSIEIFLQRRQSRIVEQGGFVEEKYIEFCKRNVTTFAHYHGGCLVGSVVDGNYNVLGVDGLRVIDGSTLTDSPGTNPMATLLMLGRYQGIKILRERQGH